MTTSLITGAAGLIGSHLAEALQEAGDRLIATYLNPTINLEDLEGKVTLTKLDILDREAVAALIEAERPDVIYHLAAQSLPTVSWTDPWRTLETNIIGTVNIFEAIKEIRGRGEDYDPTVVVACSSAGYGASMTPDRVPVDEEAPLLPLHPYGVSKVGQDLLTFQYHVNFGLRGIRARIFNCTGPRKRNDVVSDFGAGIVAADRSGVPMQVGNLSTRRAIIDIRDMVAALMALARSGRPGEAYNICADHIVKIEEILELYFIALGHKVPYVVAPELLRPSDEPVIVGSTDKLRRDTGWAPTYRLEQTVAEVLAYEQDRWDKRSQSR